MRLAFIVCFIANMVLALVSWLILPERVAIHFGSGGLPNNWASSPVNSLILLGMHLVLFFSLYFSPRLVLMFPAKWINLPHKNYWLAPEHRTRTAGKVSVQMHQFGVAIFLLLLATGLLVIHANLSDPVRLNEPLALSFLAAFVVYTVVWCVRFFRSFRLPAEPR
jgi:uncharacterized membrane protein